MKKQTRLFGFSPAALGAAFLMSRLPQAEQTDPTMGYIVALVILILLGLFVWWMSRSTPKKR
jgi:hypothetical protein